MRKTGVHEMPYIPCSPKMSTSDKASPVSEQMASLAQQLLDGKIGICSASRQIRDLAWRNCDDPWKHEALKVFLAIDSETDHLPLGKERSVWQPAALLEKDDEIAKCDAFFREQAMSAAAHLLEEQKAR
jgi:hypothetical protein